MIDKEKLIAYHKERILHWKRLRREFKDGSYSLNEICEIRVDTHEVVIKLIESGKFDNIQTT